MISQNSDHDKKPYSPSLDSNRRNKKNIFKRLSQVDLRLLSVVILITIAFFTITIRILFLTFGERNENQLGEKQQRGTIIDFEGTPIAYSEERYNIYYNPRVASLNLNQINSIQTNLRQKINADQIAKKTERNRTFLLARYIEKKTADSLIKLNLPGLLVDKTRFRIYPYDDLLSHTLGFVGHDENGLYGLELKYNDYLNYLQDPGYERNLVLNLKLDFQKKIEDLTKTAVKENNADYGSIIVQDIQTGHILGLANYPSFNLNTFTSYSSQAFLNRSTTYLLEPGSIFKIFFIAYLIERFNPRLDEKKYLCEGFYELSNGEIIKCHGVHGKISIQDIIKYSCNSGIIQATETLTPEEMFNFLKRLRIGQPYGIDLPGESRGLILNLKDWGVRTKATIPLGHGLALTPLHLINIFSALIGKGYLYQPQMVRYLDTYQDGKLIDREEIAPEIINKVISEEVSQKTVDLLYYGTIKGSTGYSSRSTGFDQVFGKTATSQLANITSGGYYTNRYHSIFAGGYPLQNPRYSILVAVSRPQREYYGGKVAAPIYAQVIEALNIHYNLTEERNIEVLRDILDQESPNDEYLEEFLVDHVPDFIGLSVRKAVVLLEDFKKIQKKNNIQVNYNLMGSGYVVKQNPSPQSPVRQNTSITLFFK